MRIARVPGLGAAATLTAATLGVFGVFQNYGPESAVRRFNHAVATDHGTDLDRDLEPVIVGSPEDSASRQLTAILAGFLASSPGYSIVKSERSATRVDMLAVYGRKTLVWVVVKAGDRWRVDPFQTLQALQHLGYQ